MRIKVCITNEIPSFGMGHRQVEFAGCDKDYVLLKKSKKRKILSKKEFEHIYIDSIPIEELYCIPTTIRKTIFKQSNNKERSRVYQQIRKKTPYGTISKDIIDGVIKNSKGI